MGSMDVPTERIVYHLLYEALQSDRPVIWICLKDTPNTILDKFSSYELPLTELEKNVWFVDATMMGDRVTTIQAQRCTFMDYACIIIEVGKLLKKNPASLVMLDNMSMLIAFDRIEGIARPLKYLDSIIRAEGGAFISMLLNKAMPGSVEAELISLMDIVINVENEKIGAHVGSNELTIPFRFTGKELIFGGRNLDNELRELFNFSSEEKKELEREVEEKARYFGG